MKYFELTELLASEEALKRRIDNSPSWEVVEHLRRLVEDMLDPLREAWGSPLHVNSGYRCAKLNSAVKGSSTSAHLRGYAADIVPGNGRIEEFISFAIDWARSKGIKFDQIIDEKDGRGNHWCHIGLYNSYGQQRGEVKKMIKK